MADNPPPKEPGYVDGDKRKGPIGRTLNEIVQQESGGRYNTARELLDGTRAIVDRALAPKSPGEQG